MHYKPHIDRQAADDVSVAAAEVFSDDVRRLKNVAIFRSAVFAVSVFVAGLLLCEEDSCCDG